MSLHIGVDARELQGRPTGTGRYLRSLLRHWLGSSDEHFTLYFNGPAPASLGLESPRLRLRPIGSAPTSGLVWQELRLPRVAGADGLDVFFAPAFSCPLRLRLPRVTAVHDMAFYSCPEDFSPFEGLRRRLLVGASLRASERLTTVSDFSRREIAAWASEAAARTSVIAHGPDDDLPPAPSRAAARERLGCHGPLILSVGSIFNRRRLPTLLEALRLLRRSLPASLDVVGDNRTYPRLDLAGLVRERGLETSVRLSGFVTEAELADRYAAADAFVFLSDYEGFGLPVLEAMARGLPVVTSERPATGELFAEAALVVDPADPDAVASALERALASGPFPEELRARGRALASRFSWADAAERTLGVLREAAAS